MTDEADALLRAVLATPDDDAPRLIFADWLDEHGDPARAEFIRVQVELGRPDPDRARRYQLLTAERRLLFAYRAAWTAWLPPWAYRDIFRRGFLEGIMCKATDFIARADEVRGRTPLSSVQLNGTEGEAVPVFRSRALDGIRSLTLSLPVSAGEWTHLGASTYLGRLRELVLNAKGPADEMIDTLIGSESLPALRRLRLPWCHLEDEHVARLVGHPWVGRLRRLDLSNNVVTAEGGQAIVASPHLDRLVSLNLRGNPVADTWVAEKLRRRFEGRVRL